MTARTIIAKLVAFLFVQILSVRIQNLHNVRVLLLGTGKNFCMHFWYCLPES
jgi:hypothetical protein